MNISCRDEKYQPNKSTKMNYIKIIIMKIIKTEKKNSLNRYTSRLSIAGEKMSERERRMRKTIQMIQLETWVTCSTMNYKHIIGIPQGEKGEI